jgi:hypothetical protein
MVFAPTQVQYLFTTYYLHNVYFYVKNQPFVTAESDNDPDPHWFGSLDPDPH